MAIVCWVRRLATARFPSRAGSSWQLSVESLERRLTPATLTVRNTHDSGTGSLRAALLSADLTPGPDRITFAIPASDPGFVDANHDHQFEPGDYWSIAPATPLPAVTGQVFLDGWSQGGFGYHDSPLIELNGAAAGNGTDGLLFDHVFGGTVRGLAINRFDGSGIALENSSDLTLVGNFLGTDPGGRVALGNNQAGLFLSDSARNTIGGTRPGERNLVSGNHLQGIHVEGAGSFANRIVGNLVGSTVSGDTALGNGSQVYLGDGIRLEGASFNVIGGATPAERNVVAGNFDDGIDLHDGSTHNVVEGNYVGIDITGTRPLGNGADGVYLQNASFNLIGSTVSGDANVIGNNGYNGVFLYGDSHANAIIGNFIGTNARGDRLGNGAIASFADGIFLAQFDTPRGPSNNRIIGNTIANNAGGGITIDLNAEGNSVGNSILANSIHDNGGLAIDLGEDGVTPNHPGGSPTGPNHLQNYPILQPPVANGDGTSTLSGTLNATPNSVLRIEFFASSRGGDADVFLGAITVVTDASGNSPTFHLTFRPVAGKPFLTATATNLLTGDTSEVSAAVS
jgi:titin